jgi:hypothetical protein
MSELLPPRNGIIFLKNGLSEQWNPMAIKQWFAKDRQPDQAISSKELLGIWQMMIWLLQI